MDLTSMLLYVSERATSFSLTTEEIVPKSYLIFEALSLIPQPFLTK